MEFAIISNNLPSFKYLSKDIDKYSIEKLKHFLTIAEGKNSEIQEALSVKILVDAISTQLSL
jgi:hypothetical protein